LVDVGANIGDTAAIMATYSPSPIVLVEASEFYCRFLRNNVARIPNRTSIHQTLVSGRPREEGTLKHVGGTARFDTIAGSESWIDCKRLSDVAGA
jgi:FkbM family methyltransferase